MSRHYLVPVKDTDDADKALARIPEVLEKGDELMLLVISEVPEGELIGSQPPPTVMDPLATTGGVATGGRVGGDQPVFLGREEIMESRRQELRIALNPRIAQLNEQGYTARMEAMFSDEPGETIRDYAGDLGIKDILVTSDFHADLDSTTRDTVRTL